MAKPALFAEIEVADPLPVSLARIVAKPTVINADIANAFLNDLAVKKVPGM